MIFLLFLSYTFHFDMRDSHVFIINSFDIRTDDVREIYLLLIKKYLSCIVRRTMDVNNSFVESRMK